MLYDYKRFWDILLFLDFYFFTYWDEVALVQAKARESLSGTSLI